MFDPTNALRVLPIEADLLVWLTVFGNLQLALRHPRNEGASRQLIERFTKELGEKLVQEGMLTQKELEDAERLERQAFGS